MVILLNKEARKISLEWKPVSERIIIARLKTIVRPVTLVQCYAPTEMANNEEKVKFYGQIQTVLRSIIIMGGLSDQLREEYQGAVMMTGKHGLGKLNDNGEMFLELWFSVSL
jgi:hypothetical protein